MGHVFAIDLPPDFDASTFDVLDLEPDIDGVDWVEDDPQLPGGSASMYVHGRSTCAVELHLDRELEVWVPSLSSSVNWDLAFGVLERAAEAFETVFVTWNDDLWELPELVAHCGAQWQDAEFAEDERMLTRRIAAEGTVSVKGPMRSAHIGGSVMESVGAGECTLQQVLLRTNFIEGPHLAARAVTDVVDGVVRTVSVLGPGLRTLLPPVDAVLLDTIDSAQPPVLLDAASLDRLDGLDVTRLDEGHRLIQAVPEAQWPAVLNAALQSI